MTSINTNYNSGYYSLNSTNGAVTPPATIAAQNSASYASVGFDADAYLLDLSPEARQYLTQASNTSVTQQSNFLLSPEQQRTITAILTKYKDAPYSQDTFNRIQDDLREAGLSADQLKMKDKADNFNATQLFLDVLNGKDSAPFNSLSDETEDSKATNFMKTIVNQWQGLNGSNSLTRVGSYSAHAQAGEKA